MLLFSPLITLHGYAANLIIAPRSALGYVSAHAPCDEYALRSALRDIASDSGNIARLRAFAQRYDLLRPETVADAAIIEAIITAARGRFAAWIIPDVIPEKPVSPTSPDKTTERAIEPLLANVPACVVQFGAVRQVGVWGEFKSKVAPSPPPPPPVVTRLATRPPPPPPRNPDSATAPPSAAAQAQTRKQAANAGAPFCEICERMRANAG